MNTTYNTSYYEFDFKVSPLTPWSEILMAELIEVGFDSFTENSQGIMAYIPQNLWNKEALDEVFLMNHDQVQIKYTFEEMPNINWNEQWEKNFSPINVEDRVLIRAEFHPTQNKENEIIIQPKMSFGTGHHATTYLMIQQMMEMDFSEKKVLDMGCGTSILGIYALQRKAKRVLAIDIDQWAVDNSAENATRNGVELRVELGTADNLGAEEFEIILANINRNILISDIPRYVKVLQKGGELLLSGLCFFDVQDILEVCENSGLTLEKKIQREEWVSLLLSLK